MDVWFDQLRPRRQRIQAALGSTNLIHRPPWTAVDLGRLLLSLNRLRDVRSGLLLVGAPLDEQAQLESLLDHCSRRIGRLLFPTRNRTQPALRRRQQSAQVERVWETYDHAAGADRSAWEALAEGFMQWCRPDQLDVLLLHRRHRLQMQTFIEVVKLDPSLAICEPEEGGLDSWRFPKDNQTYHGLAIKRVLAVLWMVGLLNSERHATSINGA